MSTVDLVDPTVRRPNVGEPDTGRLAVVGAGVMGTGIATLAVGHGIPVVLVDVSDERLAESRRQIQLGLRHGRLMGALPADIETGVLTTTLSLDDIESSTAVVEAVVEDAAMKEKVLAQASATVAAGTPLISNTSGIPIAELAEAVCRPEDLVGTHFMNPAYLITMVEVVRGPATSVATMLGVHALLGDMGRRGMVVADSPGFVTSRLLHPMINDAVHVVADGVADVETVDELMRGCLGHPTGPLRTADLIGLDNLADALRLLAERTGNDRHRPAQLLLDKVAAGDLGRKSGRGFYDYGKVLT
jgi:methoxymalonate biosynthesis protein